MRKQAKSGEITVAEAGRRGGEARAANMSKKERSEGARNAALARWANMSPKERSETLRKAALARWAKKKAAKAGAQ